MSYVGPSVKIEFSLLLAHSLVVSTLSLADLRVNPNYGVRAAVQVLLQITIGYAFCKTGWILLQSCLKQAT